MRRLNPMDPYGRGVGLGLAAIDEVGTEVRGEVRRSFLQQGRARIPHRADGGAHTGALVAQAQAKTTRRTEASRGLRRTKIMGGIC